MTQLARDNAGPPLVFQLLWYPSLTADLSLPSYTENANAPILDTEVIAAFVTWYAPSLDITDPKTLPTALAPANAADLSGLPPAFIGTAEHDPIRDDGAHYAELLRAAGVPVELSQRADAGARLRQLRNGDSCRRRGHRPRAGSAEEGTHP